MTNPLITGIINNILMKQGFKNQENNIINDRYGLKVNNLNNHQESIFIENVLKDIRTTKYKNEGICKSETKKMVTLESIGGKKTDICQEQLPKIANDEIKFVTLASIGKVYNK